MPNFYYKTVKACTVSSCNRKRIIFPKGIVIELPRYNPRTELFIRQRQIRRCDKDGNLICLKKKKPEEKK